MFTKCIYGGLIKVLFRKVWSLGGNIETHVKFKKHLTTHVVKKWQPTNFDVFPLSEIFMGSLCVACHLFSRAPSDSVAKFNPQIM